ncbi:MAG: Permease of the drug/metabolite transporter (DMT) superfamily [Candidatus Saccharicenans subterraneus]|uniref:Permease of the drug/metabolite transporter (DMT) superfamily n=1 Tax=Candidatus Saccharicenans subterraneus TaxID=2508984 RepID=A0A3E2BMT1_9BACT|nr:MAG: Permease of the drug/metabolite transporter (DMT) superfamily [Candidatus Saccharicenans subterraneum]
MRPRTQGVLLVNLAVLFFGFPGVIGKVLPLSPVQLTWLRVFLASLALLVVLLIQKVKPQVPGHGPRLLLLAAGFLLAFHWTAFFRAVQVSTVAVGLLSYSTFPVFTVFLEPWLLRTKFRRSYLYFAVLCFLGVGLMVPEFSLSNRIFQGVVWGILSGLSFALLAIINRMLSPGHSSLVLAFYQDSLAMIFLLPLFLSQPGPLPLGTVNAGLILFLGLVCTAGAHTIFIRGLRFIEARLSSLISSLEPVYGIIFGYLFLGELPGFRTVAGGLLILASVVIISWKSPGLGS